MWAKLGTWVANTLLLPLLMQWGKDLAAWVGEKIAKKRHTDQVKKEAEAKVKTHENANTRDSARDSFGKLP